MTLEQGYVERNPVAVASVELAGFSLSCSRRFQ